MKLTEVKAEYIEKNVEQYDGKEFLMSYKDGLGTMTSSVIKFYIEDEDIYFYFVDEAFFMCDYEHNIKFDDRGVWEDAKFYLIEYDVD